MDFLTLAKTRYSARKYSKKTVEKEKLDKILLAAQVAPTAANLQPHRLLVLQDEENLLKLKKGANVYGAPLAILVCADHSVSWKRPFDGKDAADIDASIITDHMMLQATELGLGTVWICYFNHEVIKQEFQLPENYELINILAVGYSEEKEGENTSVNRHANKRTPLESIVFHEHF